LTDYERFSATLLRRNSPIEQDPIPRRRDLISMQAHGDSASRSVPRIC
jgi:hypothetical protein